MALDFHHLETGEYLFSLYSQQTYYLSDIFEAFGQQTGLRIDLSSDLKLTVENQKQLVQIIDRYIEKTDLNKDKQKTAAILEFKGLLSFFIKGRVGLKIFGD